MILLFGLKVVNDLGLVEVVLVCLTALALGAAEAGSAMAAMQVVL